MLTRSSQVGEFYTLAPPQTDPGENRRKFSADILVYDEESDKHVRITWAEALAACCIGTVAGGDADTVDPTKLMSLKTAAMTDAQLGTWLVAAQRIEAFNEQKADPFPATPPAAGTTPPPPTFDSLDQGIRIVVARPFIEHLMVHRNPSSFRAPLVACAPDHRFPLPLLRSTTRS